MQQTLTAKLKLEVTQEQKEQLRVISLAYRDALNYTSGVASEMGKTYNGTKIQKEVYYTLREQFKLSSQMACNVPRQVGATYKSLRTKLKQNEEAIKAGRTKKRYKGLDKPPKYVSRTCTLNYQRDYSFVKDQKVSVITLNGRLKVNYHGYSKHLEMIKSGVAKIGAAKLWYLRATKTYYLLVSMEVEVPELTPTDINRVMGVDVGQRYIAVAADTRNKTQFFSGKQVRHKAVLSGSLAVKVDAHYTSQACPCCGHTSKENRPQKGLTFVCQPCGYTLHADLVGARNVALRVLLSRQDWESTGRFSAVPDASSDETKGERLSRYLQLRWTTDAIPN
ncbi:RNA-guided endonuclease InsQ/TnpB family protein [Coleofasciculus sp.]|uniref:RNA-guided endonuclease InsQ/TnpB family protein n=1 Tax=Coleofasciculus sp. TaxID=3100458 RepID=UPI0039F8D079